MIVKGKKATGYHLIDLAKKKNSEPSDDPAGRGLLLKMEKTPVIRKMPRTMPLEELR